MPVKKTNAVKTPEQVKQEFSRQGITLADFAREHALSYATVYQVLAGKKKGRRGESHRAAVLLGLKDGVIPPRASAQGAAK